MRVSRGVVLLLMAALRPHAAAAQDTRGESVAGGVSAAKMESSTTASVSGAFEYRFTPIVGLELEATFTPTLKGPFPEQPLTIADPLSGLPATTRSEERRVGKEGRSRWWPGHEEKKSR